MSKIPPAKEILFIIPSMRGGGAERVLLNLCKGLDKSRFRITIAVLDFKGDLWNNIPGHVKKIHLKVPNIFSKLGRLLYRKLGCKLLLRFQAARLREEFDVVFSFIDSPYTEVMYYLKYKPRKKYLVVHSSYISYSDRNSLITSAQQKRMLLRYNKADGIVFVSNESMQQFKLLFPTRTKCMVIYNPLDIKDILVKADKGENNMQNEVFTFLSIGSLIPVKNFTALIQAASIVKKSNQEFKVVILGKGALEADLRKEISVLDLEDYVELRGFVSNPYPLMKHADALVISSLSEGLPTVMCEAMILGKPIIAPDISGCREVSNEGQYSVQYDGTTYKNLAQEMLLMMQNPTLVKSYARLAKKRAEIFDDGKAISMYEQLMD